jgi:hypothetical protein
MCILIGVSEKPGAAQVRFIFMGQYMRAEPHSLRKITGSIPKVYPAVT